MGRAGIKPSEYPTLDHALFGFDLDDNDVTIELRHFIQFLYTELSFVFNPDDPDTLVSSVDFGGIPIGTTIGELRGLTISDFLVLAAFPVVEAYVSVPKSISFSGVTEAVMEIGSVVNFQAINTLDKGFITNGNEVVAGYLIGDLLSLTIEDNNSNIVYHTVNASNNTNATMLLGYAVEKGENKWKVIASHGSASTTYFNNRNIQGVDLATEQDSGVLYNYSDIITGVYFIFIHIGGANTAPINSEGVRDLVTKIPLNISNEGSMNLFVPALTQEVVFFIPMGQTAVVEDIGNGTILTNVIVKSSFTVKDGNSIDVAYEKNTINLGAGFRNDTNFNIIIT
jgi:hypothetical protein